MPVSFQGPAPWIEIRVNVLGDPTTVESIPIKEARDIPYINRDAKNDIATTNYGHIYITIFDGNRETSYSFEPRLQETADRTALEALDDAVRNFQAPTMNDQDSVVRKNRRVHDRGQYEVSARFPISNDELRGALQTIQAYRTLDKMDIIGWNAFDRTCTTFSLDVLRAANQDVGVDNPSHGLQGGFVRQLLESGNGNPVFNPGGQRL